MNTNPRWAPCGVCGQTVLTFYCEPEGWYCLNCWRVAVNTGQEMNRAAIIVIASMLAPCAEASK